MGLIGFMALLFLLLCVGATIAISALILLIIFGLISAGILSASVMSGIYKRSFAAGFKTFVYFSGCIFGTLSGIVFFVLLNKVSHWWPMKEALLVGSMSGLAGGFLISIIVISVVQKLSTFLKEKIIR